MKSKLIIAIAISLVAYPSILTQNHAVAGIAIGAAGHGQNTNLFSSDELDNLLAPIALYPDPLLAQMLPASTFVDQIQQAAQWLRANNNAAGIDNQPWDVSVKAVAHYSDVLYKMSDQPDWTTALGQAYTDQSSDVSASIQRLRAQARNAGTLVSSPQQTVAADNGALTIVPAQPSVIYVPTYDPYYAYYPSTGAIVASSLISFGAGFAIGAWLNRGWNWWGGGPFYHGWVGGGWIARSRPFVNWHNNAYVGNRFNNININRNVVNRNINTANLNRFNSLHRNTNWGNIDRANMTRHARPSPGTLPARPGAPGAITGRPGAGGRPGMPGTPGARPGIPGTPGARPGTPGARPGTPGARPGTTLPATRPATPGTMPSRPGMTGGRPGTLPGNPGVNRPSTSRPGGFNRGGGGSPRVSSPMQSRPSMGGGRSHGGFGGGGMRGGGGHRGGGRRR